MVLTIAATTTAFPRTCDKAPPSNPVFWQGENAFQILRQIQNCLDQLLTGHSGQTSAANQRIGNSASRKPVGGLIIVPNVQVCTTSTGIYLQLSSVAIARTYVYF